MKSENKFIHVKEGLILLALEAALQSKTVAASSFFVPPKNSRAYLCKVDGCSRPAYAQGFCNAHYIRSRKGVDMALPVRARKRDDLCAECGCETGAKGGWGLCPQHYKKERLSILKDAAIQILGGKCCACGGVFHRSVYDFHHLRDKEGSPSQMFLNRSLPVVARELSKCVLLCANCHRLEHNDELRSIISQATRT